MNAEGRPEAAHGQSAADSSTTVRQYHNDAEPFDDELGSEDDRFESPGRLTFTRASDVRPERVRWLRQSWIPIGALTMLAGQPGLGKSTLAYEFAARLTRGQLDGDRRGIPSAVLVATLEDHIGAVAVPRLTAAGADLGLVQFVGVRRGADEPLTFPDDLDEIIDAVITHQAALLVVDPIVAALDPSIDGHRDQHVRRALAPLAKMAEDFMLAVLAVMHLNKGQTDNLLSKVSGSVAFTAAPRSVIIFGRHPDDPDGENGAMRVAVHAKCNLAPQAPSLALRMEGRTIEIAGMPIETNVLVETGECDVAGSDLLRREPDRSEVDRASEFIEDHLGDGEWHASGEMKAIAHKQGIADRTLLRAAKRLHVTFERRGYPGRMHWRLPVTPAPSTQALRRNSEQPENSDISADTNVSCAKSNGWRNCAPGVDCLHLEKHSASHRPHPDTGRFVCWICHTPPAGSQLRLDTT